MQRGASGPVGIAGLAFHDGLKLPAQGVNDGRGFLTQRRAPLIPVHPQV